MWLLCQTEDVPERDAKSFDSPKGTTIVAQRDGQFYAYLNRCPNLGVELEFQENQFMDLDREYMICANHGALFVVDSGKCIFGPCVNDALTKIDIEVHSDGGIYLL